VRDPPLPLWLLSLLCEIRLWSIAEPRGTQFPFYKLIIVLIFDSRAATPCNLGFRMIQSLLPLPSSRHRRSPHNTTAFRLLFCVYCGFITVVPVDPIRWGPAVLFSAQKVTRTSRGLAISYNNNVHHLTYRTSDDEGDDVGVLVVQT
jgi:hypothetical protein